MKVTVILPVYTVQNSNRTREAIESILNQSYKNLELVVVSELTETLEHIKRICVSKRLTLLHSTRQGLGACLNLAISETNAKFIARMDDDDVALPDRIEKQVKYLINNNLDLVGSGIEYMTKKKTNNPIPELAANPFAFEVLELISSQRTIAKKVEVLKKYKHNLIFNL